MFIRLALVLLLAAPAFGKSLHWNAIDVEARLDRDGNLHVVETQRMVFDGDYNGGERDFNLRPRQSVDVHRIVRIDGAKEVPLAQGSLDNVDHWDFSGSGVVRWRSRMPSDPPFANQELTYRLDYTYRNALQIEGEQYRLDHDFGLPTRDGIVKRFTLRLTFDPVWGAQPVSIARENQPPGEGVPVDQPLKYGAEGSPAGIERPMSAAIPVAVLVLFAAGFIFIVQRFVAAEKQVGRLEPIVARFDDELLELDPEVAGAVWDAGVGAPEVAAVIARMTQEGKLTTRAEDGTLHMHLEARRKELKGYERELVDKLFYDGGHDTDTDSIKSHYASKGFDPSKEIREGVEVKLDKLADWSTKEERYRLEVNIGLLIVALLLLAGSAFLGESDVAAAVIGFFATGFFGLFACLSAVHFSKNITNVGTAMIAPTILMVIASAPLVISCLLAPTSSMHAPVLFALMLWTLALAKMAFDLLRIRDTPKKISYRKRIAGAREYFIEQLRRDQPDMRDEWFPYVLAFGLGQHVDRWFRSFGGETSRSSGMSSSYSSSSSSSSSSSGWTGGGGAFGGAGASGTWAVAAGVMAAGVSAPSSSGSSGGGGGGSSSGGGGGGGW
ncbi:MAG TPA: DUF2207 domain-containing protein [Thermoanaerobaculia bacterium]|nr:DUF2207 domain-containing protein [Thermoanaerobaculia bacterium]